MKSACTRSQQTRQAVSPLMDRTVFVWVMHRDHGRDTDACGVGRSGSDELRCDHTAGETGEVDMKCPPISNKHSRFVFRWT